MNFNLRAFGRTLVPVCVYECSNESHNCKSDGLSFVVCVTHRHIILYAYGVTNGMMQLIPDLC